MKTAQAGMLAAILIAPGCNDPSEPGAADGIEPLRRALFRSLAARDHVVNCPGAVARPETRTQIERLEELKQLALAKEAGQALWLGENDWAGLARYSDREPCGQGEAPYRAALGDFSTSLDALAREVADFRE